MPDPTRISIVEDDGPTRDLLIAMVVSAPALTLASHYGLPEPALRGLVLDRPDVVLMDINLPRLTGVECVRRLRPQLPDTQFLMLTVYEDHDHILAALAAGATGYLLKGTRREELLAGIDQIVHGGSPMSGAIARKVVQSFARTEPAATRSELETLSQREQDVLALLTQGFLYKEISDRLGVSVPTVCTHIRRIYEKLQVRSRSEAIAKYFKQAV
jgi:DNA-binding NarL/FixJ family response regulator